MSARFEVHRAQNLKDRYLFALSGVIREGMVHIGMDASLEGEGDGPFKGTVHSVEYLEPNGDAEPALTFHYRDPRKIERWESIDWEGKELHLEW